MVMMFEERLKGTSAIVGVAVNIMRDESFFKCVYIIVSVCVTNLSSFLSLFLLLHLENEEVFNFGLSLASYYCSSTAIPETRRRYL
jgi:hypothetical protein